MSIVKISGQEKSSPLLIANALRNAQVSSGKGALLMTEKINTELDPLIEKLIIGIKLPDEVPLNWKDELPWKTDPMIIMVNEAQELLPLFEKRLPGFSAVFGPVVSVITDVD